MKNRLHFDTTLGEKANLAFSALKKETETIGYYAYQTKILVLF